MSLPMVCNVQEVFGIADRLKHFINFTKSPSYEFWANHNNIKRCSNPVPPCRVVDITFFFFGKSETSLRMRTIIANFFALPCILQHTDTHRWCCRTETRWIFMLYVVFILYGGNMKIKVRHYTFSSTTTRGISQYFGHAFFIILHTYTIMENL